MRNIVIIFFLAMGAVVAGYYLAPNHKEVALMEMNDAHFKDALQYYSSLQAKGDNSINVLVPLINLHMHYGDIDPTIALLKSFLAQNPNSIEGHKKLATIYKSSQRFHNYCKELEIVQQLSPSTDTLRELADTYDFLGMYEKEMQALARLVVSKGYRPHEEDYINLASFFRVNHQSAEAVETILVYIDFKKYDVNIDTMHLAMQLLLETGEEPKALSIAQKYLAEYGKESNAIMLSVLFQQQARFHSAYVLLEPYLQNIEHSPDLLQQVVTLQLAEGKEQDAYKLLSEQFSKGVMPNTLAITLIDLAVKYKNYALAESVLHATPLEQVPEDALLRYADLWFQLKHRSIALYMQTRLGKDYLRQAPLLSALLDVAAHDTPETMAALLAVPPEYMPLPEQKMLVAGIYVQHGLTKRAFALLDGMSVADMLSTLDAPQYAQLYLDANESDRAARLLNAALPDSTPDLQKSINKTLLMLAVGQGKTEAVDQWFKQHPDDNGQWIPDAYWLASRYHRNELSLVLAQRIFRMDPTPQNRMELTEALLLNHRYAEALGDLQSLSQKDPAARAMYLEVMSDWIHRAGIKEVPDANRKVLESLVMSMLKHNDMSLQEKRNMAYLLEVSGFPDKAESVFLSVAGDQPFSNSDVSELLGFWGDHLSPGALAWVENRARNAPGGEKAQWLAYLNATGHAQSVLALLHSLDGLPPAVADEYINALVATHSTQQLSAALAKEIDREENAAQIRKFTLLARQEDLPAIADKGWHKLYALDPNNPDAEKELGLQAFEANHYSEAGRFLEKYLQHNKGDYRVNYAYAEFLQHQQKKEQAKTYFQQALNQLSEIKPKTVLNQLDEAHLLYRNNELEQATALYRKLLSQYPENKTLRADFAEILIETKQFEEASLVLDNK